MLGHCGRCLSVAAGRRGCAAARKDATYKSNKQQPDHMTTVNKSNMVIRLMWLWGATPQPPQSRILGDGSRHIACINRMDIISFCVTWKRFSESIRRDSGIVIDKALLLHLFTVVLFAIALVIVASTFLVLALGT
jgi:hypothetical protein